jgi:hypothetical protein
MNKTVLVAVALLLLGLSVAVVASSWGIETQKAEFVTLVRPDGGLSECKLPSGSVLGSRTSWLNSTVKGAEREVYSVPFGSPGHSGGGCQAGDRILDRTIENGR